MRKITRRTVSMVLVITMLFLASVTVFAENEEEYISDLRIIYAEDYNKAADILDNSGLECYKLLTANLNENTGKIGVFLVYKSTADIEDAITDISVMQMNGGYNEGNYQKMIAKSYAEYLETGSIYLQAIDYFVKAYDSDDFLAKSVMRQLNLYTGLDDHDGENLGDIFYNGIDEAELATMFMEGNKYVLTNIRSLLAMGVSYNEGGKHYLDKVADEAAKMNENPDVYEYENYDEIASIIAGNILTFGDMFAELSAYEDQLDYTDEEFTDLELQYAEYMSFADRMREVNYLNGKTLYDFCLEYTFNSKDLVDLYPLVAALNDGQEAMTRVSHYYDVVLYSMSDLPEEKIEEELASLEEKYAGIAFNVYAGVDRSIYDSTFALTSDAYRANAYTESGFWSSLVDPGNGWGITALTSGSISVICAVWGICRTVKASMMTNSAYNAVEQAKQVFNEAILRSAHNNTVRDVALISSCQQFFGYKAEIKIAGKIFYYNDNGDKVVNALFEKVFPDMVNKGHAYDTKILMLKSATGDIRVGKMTEFEENVLDNLINKGLKQSNNENFYEYQRAFEEAKKASEKTAQTVNGMSTFTKVLYITSGVSLLISAITTGVSIYNYYNPSYDDIPTAMVDLIDTPDGDRYIKYDVVYEAECNEDGGYSAADLNAFSANRWNALYYTKSYEAGKPLLAGDFKVSYSNNTPDKDYAPVHRFGELVSYNLNKYNFNDNQSIYLSVKQSEKQKSAVADVPEIVGSVFSSGQLVIAGVLGAATGVGATVGVNEIVKKRKKEAEVPAEVNTEA